ncbi:protein starmaker-like [Mercenaria mercenaria]|uniref:protein starmaker-like n=1 Tax=Mercenaria mercenaria TaxID=6596 RepID=UPI00234ED430|nr:protein starmaker-like [Mercenaria mercenaria]
MITFRWFAVLTKTTRHLSDNNSYFYRCRNTLSVLMSGRKFSEHKKTMVGPKPPTEAGSSSEKSKAKKEEFEFFFGNKFIFSQFHPAKFTVDEITYNCMEQYMHHQKAVTFKDNVRAYEIMRTTDPKQQKKLGRQVTPFDKGVWGQKCVAVVMKGSLAKYRQNLEMKKALFASYPKTLVEASPRDRLWGIGLGRNNIKAQDRATWRGKNLLGDTLTKVRNKMMKEEGLISVSEQGTLTNVKEERSSAEERNERPEEQKTPTKDKGIHSSSKERKEKSEEKKTPSKDKGKHTSSEERIERSEEKHTPKDKGKHMSSRERKERSEEKQTSSKDKVKHSSSKDREERSEERKKPSKDKGKTSSSKDREERSEERKTPSKDKGKHLSSKDTEERSEDRKTPSKDKGKHSSSKDTEERSADRKTPSKDKGKHSSSKDREERSEERKKKSKDKRKHSSSKDREERSDEQKTLSKDKGKHISSKEMKERPGEQKLPSEDKGEHSSSMKKKESSDEQETSFIEVKHLSSEKSDRNETSLKDVTSDLTSSHLANTPKNEEQQLDISFTCEKTKTEHVDHSASEERKEVSDSREALSKDETSVEETNECIMSTSQNTPSEDKYLSPSKKTVASSDSKEVTFSEYSPPPEETNVLETNLSESTPTTKEHSRKRQWLPSEEKSENDIKPHPLKKVKLSTDVSTCSLKQPKITHFTIQEKD